MAQVRLATDRDASAMLAIYAPYILNTSVTFETEVPTPDAFAERTKGYLQSYPWLVCEIGGQIAGYAYASKYRERVAYQWSVESSVYVAEPYMQHGVAKALYTALLAILKQQYFTNVYAVINLPNERSVAFHEKLGFTHFADYKNVGYKSGKWKTVGWWQKQVNEYVDEPAAPIKFYDVEKTFLQKVFEKAAGMVKY